MAEDAANQNIIPSNRWQPVKSTQKGRQGGGSNGYEHFHVLHFDDEDKPGKRIQTPYFGNWSVHSQKEGNYSVLIKATDSVSTTFLKQTSKAAHTIARGMQPAMEIYKGDSVTEDYAQRCLQTDVRGSFDSVEDQPALFLNVVNSGNINVTITRPDGTETKTTLAEIIRNDQEAAPDKRVVQKSENNSKMFDASNNYYARFLVNWDRISWKTNEDKLYTTPKVHEIKLRVPSEAYMARVKEELTTIQKGTQFVEDEDEKAMKQQKKN